MNRRVSGGLGSLTATAFLVLVLSACGSSPVSPLPGQAPSASTVPSSAVSSPTPGSPAPTRTTSPTNSPRRPSAKPTLPPACLGAVMYTVDAAGGDPIPASLCLTAGAVLRVRHVAGGTLRVGGRDERLD